MDIILIHRQYNDNKVRIAKKKKQTEDNFVVKLCANVPYKYNTGTRTYTAGQQNCGIVIL